MDFIKRLEDHRSTEKKLAWQGTFLEYLDIVKKIPEVAQLSHARIYEMIRSAGIEEINGVKSYKFFSSEIFGLDKTLEKLVEEYFHPAARRLDVRKRILLLMGPVSGGKSTLVSMLKQGVEKFSRSGSGGIYAIKGCPMHEEPLHLIPKALREEFQNEYKVYVEGELCPSCRMMLEEEYGGQIEKVAVERIFLSEEKRLGIGTFTPSDPKSQDIADLTGSVDFSTITEFGSESDPRAYRFDGELNIANRGLMEFQHIPRTVQQILNRLLEAVPDHYAGFKNLLSVLYSRNLNPFNQAPDKFRPFPASHTVHPAA
ncbi:MAG: Putative Ser protein kinase [Desulfotomaculum sp. 46_80]|nr:MAG: Putative Ser protein kinase [Desulfotomaculum sp. 46_80]